MSELRPSRIALAAVAVLGLFGAGAVTGLTLTGFSEADEPAPPRVVVDTPTTKAPEQPSKAPFRAFSADSWWNTPLPDDPPQNPFEDEILDYLSTAEESRDGCLTLAGAGNSPWGQPIYWAGDGDPEYDVLDLNEEAPPELDRLRIPAGAESADNSDDSMTIFDRGRGYVVALTAADYDQDSDEWSASSATVTYLESNGLHALTGRSDDDRNLGAHRGNNGAAMAVRFDEVQAGGVPHVLKIAAGPEVADRAVFPMVGSDGDYNGSDPAVPPQGLRLRIKPSIDLRRFNLPPQALVIARALQRYGVYIGDSGGNSALKLENTVAEGRGQLWDVNVTDLCGLPFEPAYWDVLQEGYSPVPAPD